MSTAPATPGRLDEIHSLLCDRSTAYAQRCNLHAERDKILCACGHVCGMHGSFDPDPDLGFVGIGRGPCGAEHLDPLMRWITCDCPQMTETQTRPDTSAQHP